MVFVGKNSIEKITKNNESIKKPMKSLPLGERRSSVFTHFLSDESLGDNSEALSMMAGTGGDTFSRLCTAGTNQHQ